MPNGFLLEPIDLTEFGARAVATFQHSLHSEQGFFYHFALGSLVIEASHIHGVPLTPADFIRRSTEYRLPLNPRTFARYGPGVYLAGEIMQWHQEEVDQWGENYRLLASAGATWGLTCIFMEGDVLAGVAGITRPFEKGDYTRAEFKALEKLFPTLQKGFLQAAVETRKKLLGNDAAAIFEGHPNALFLFQENGELAFVNYAGRLLMQSENPGRSEPPMAQRSALIKTLREHLGGRDTTHPSIASVDRRILRDWGPEQQTYTLFVVNAKGGSASYLSPRQKEIMQCMITGMDTARAAEELGISTATLRTHLRNIYRKLGASGLSEAIALFRTGNDFQD